MCFWIPLACIVMLGVLMLTAGFATDLKVRDGTTAGWELLAFLVCIYFTTIFLKYGNSIVSLLGRAMDQGPSAKATYTRVTLIWIHFGSQF